MPQLRSWEESGPPHFFSLEAVCHFLRDQLVCPHLCSRLSLSKLCIAPFVYKEVRSDLAKLHEATSELTAEWVLVCSQSRRWVLGRRHSYSERRPNSRQSHFRSLFPLSFHSPPAPLSRWIACPLRQRWWCIRACSLSLTSHPIIATHSYLVTQLVRTYNLFGSVRFLLLSNSSASPSLHCLYKLYSVRAYFSNSASSLCASSLEPAKTLQAIWKRFRMSLSS